MKHVKIKRENGTYRLAQKIDGPSKTDQSDKNYLCINNIMKNYLKTGVLPQFKEKVAQYIDMTQIPSYMEAHEQIGHANKLFMQLPAEIRKLMDNNPANMEKILKNEDYKEILIKHGVLERKEEKASASSQSENASQDKAKAASGDDKK